MYNGKLCFITAFHNNFENICVVNEISESLHRSSSDSQILY